MNELIIVKQLPIIEEQLKTISDEIDRKLSIVNCLVCDENTVKEVKNIRAEFNKDFRDLEEKRKTVKEEVMKPYNNFEDIYKVLVSEKYKNADVTLKGKIDSVENQLKLEKENQLRKYFESNNTTDFLTYEKLNLNVTLSATINSLEKQIDELMAKINDDLLVIEKQEHKEEVLVEYQKSLHLATAISAVQDRHLILDMLKEKTIEKEKKEEVKEHPKNEEIEEILTATFMIATTLEKMRELKKFMIDNEISFKAE